MKNDLSKKYIKNTFLTDISILKNNYYYNNKYNASNIIDLKKKQRRNKSMKNITKLQSFICEYKHNILD